VLTRWIGVAGLGLLYGALQLLLALTILPRLSAEALPRLDEIAEWLALMAVGSLAMAATLVLFSTLLPGMGDAAAAFGLLFLLAAAIEFFPLVPFLARLVPAIREVGHFVFPALQPGVQLITSVSVASNTAIALVLAVAVMNRREILLRGDA
jgi:hypothetical protein